jgi:DNA-binding MarR family transcriptional regulator
MALRPSADAVQAKDLGEVLGIGAPALSGLLDRMERDGLIERKPDPRDGRASVIGLTNTGHEQRDAAVASARHLNDKLCEGFDDAELAVVERWLSAVATKFPKEKSSD